jgi:hypothetical protein
MRGLADTGRGGVLIAGGRQGQGAGKGKRGEGTSLVITPVFCSIIYVFWLSVSLREVPSDYLCYILIRIISHIFHIYEVLFIFSSNHLHTQRYHWPTHMDLIVVATRGKSGQIRIHIHTEIHTHTRTQKQKTKKGGKKEDLTTISKPQSLTSVRITDCTLRVPNKTTALFLYE